MFSISTWDRKNRFLVIPLLFRPFLAVRSQRADVLVRPGLKRVEKQHEEHQYISAHSCRGLILNPRGLLIQLFFTNVCAYKHIFSSKIAYFLHEILKRISDPQTQKINNK